MFKTRPGLVKIRLIPDLWFLEEPLIWEDEKYRITVPVGLITDCASVPKGLDWVPFLDRQGPSVLPGIMHDCLYTLVRDTYGKDWCDRRLADFCLAEGMLPWQAHAYYLGVHWFGDDAYRLDANEGVYGAIKGGNFITPEWYADFIKNGGIKKVVECLPI